MSNINLEVLDENGWRVCSAIGRSNLAKQYYLAGGTGLALQLSHRKSFDLDFFQVAKKDRINFNYIFNELNHLFGEKNIEIEFKQQDQATLKIYDVKVTFLAYPFALIESLIAGRNISNKLKGIQLASPAEIGLMKAYTIGRRATFRDYIDLYFLLMTKNISIEYILEKAPEKFIIENKTVFSKKLFLEQLVYTKDIEDKEAASLMILGEKVTPEEIQIFLEIKVKEVLERYSSGK